MKYKKIMLLFLVVILISSCSTWIPPSEKIKLGMTRQEVMKICGEPQDVGRRVDGAGVIEMWVYFYYDAWLGYNRRLGSCTIFFCNGVVRSYQD